jgi:endonuclease YncB( thermonuclease family)
MRLDATLVVYCGLALLALVKLADWAAPPSPVPGCRVGYVYDGDSVELICGTRVSTARITGLDAPELTDPKCPEERAAAEAAKRALAALVRAAAQVEVVVQGTDRFGRNLIALRLDGQDAARRMIEAGHARPYDGGRRAGWCG